ncbi:MAG: VOC family protein, partial [Acidobacteriota bacterium]
MSDEYRGHFLWYELLTPDPRAAVDFYSGIVGWDTRDWQGESEMPYTMLCRGKIPVAGVMQLPEEARQQGAPPHWLGYVGTPDVDATVESVTELAGEVLVAPQDIPEVGRFAVLADPQGAIFATYTPANEPPGAGQEPGVSEFSWHELATTDQEAAFRFYSELFGWQETDSMDMGEAGVYRMFGPGRTFGGMFDKPDAMPGPPGWLYYVSVEDVAVAAEAVKSRGGQVVNGPME